ncbi:MAG: acetylxylan esterase [Planctomycetota bacterium]|nr:acetylxylan esterase [Planctomycetota bacterium]
MRTSGPTYVRRFCSRLGSRAILAVVMVWLPSSSPAAGPHVLPDGKVPADKRLEPPKDLDGYFPFTPPKSKAEWERRAEQVRQRILVSEGLWPTPAKTPLNAVIHGRIEQPDYTVEKVYFESLPGFYVTGNLYRPKGKSGKLPGVLNPHGHWPNGRFYDCGEKDVQAQISQGAERFENGGRSPLQSRCVQLARMGCVAFFYDMIGYADSVQISQSLAHGFAKQRPEMNTVENWGLFSPPAEAHLQSVMGLQTWDSIRALDFLTSLPDVDPERIAVTGASGGGTQTFILSAIDPRVKVSIPCVMVSTAMQGGCTCENASLLRVDTGNVEFAALFAPKPLCLVSANDWTKEMATKGFPQLQEHFQLLGVPQNVQHNPYIHFQHNYNAVSRQAMYHWVNEHLKLGLPTPIVEQDYPRLTAKELTVWDEQHPKPAGGDEFERGVLRWWHADTQKQVAAAQPTDAAALQCYQDLVGRGLNTVIGRGLSAADEVTAAQIVKTDSGDFFTITGLLLHKSHGEELPVVLLQPKQATSRVAIWLHPDGKAGLFQEDGQPQPPIRRLLAAGVAVAGADLLFQGEFLADGKPVTQTRRVKNPREAAAFTFGYNSTLFAQRVHDVLTVISFVRHHESKPAEIYLVGLAGAGPWAAAARAVARDAVAKAVIDTAGFRFGKVLDLQAPEFLPGGAKYDDLPGLLAVAAPNPLWLAGEGAAAPQPILAAYRAASAERKLVTFGGTPAEQSDAAVNWLLGN